MAILPVDDIHYPAALSGQQNGRLASSILRTVGAVTMLADTSIRAWLAMRDAAAHAGIVLAPTSPPDTYRTLAQQTSLFTSRYQRAFELGVTSSVHKDCGGVRWWLLLDPATGHPYATAACPGTSNHGLALAIDVANATGARLDWLLDHAATYGFSWELQSEPWHIRYVAGDTIPAAVLAFESGDTVTDEEIAKIAAAVWAKIIGSPSLGDKAAQEFLKQGQLAKDVATEAKQAAVSAEDAVCELAVDMDTRLTAIDEELAEIKVMLAAGGSTPGAAPTVDEIADELAQRLEE